MMSVREQYNEVENSEKEHLPKYRMFKIQTKIKYTQKTSKKIE